MTDSRPAVTPEEFAQLRSKLQRHYDIVAQKRMETLGHESAASKSAVLHRGLLALETQFLSHYFSHPPRWRKLVRRVSRNRTLPDFCVVGPPKCATSDVGVSVLMHPNVIPPLAKEIQSANPETWRIYYPTARQKARHAKLHGLSLSPYLHPSLNWMEIPYALAHVRPDTKVIIVLRDPIKRLYSHWKWELFLAGKKRAAYLPFLTTFEAYVDKSLDMYGQGIMFTACQAPGLAHSVYWKAVENWIGRFARHNVLVLNIDGYFADLNAFMRRIQDFVGLPPVEIPQPTSRTNENPIQAPPPNESSIAKLREFFLPYNNRLWEVIGEQFDW